MAAPSNVVAPLRRVSMDQGEDLIYEMVTQINLLVDFARAICAQIDADNGTIGTDYVSTITDAGGTGAPSKITLRDGL